eukprot:gene23395-31736_t
MTHQRDGSPFVIDNSFLVEKSTIQATQVSNSTKKRKFSGDERLNRNRERNKIHARKTRERKKFQTVALQTRLKELEGEGRRLRTLVDETYIAGSLLGLRDSVANDGESGDTSAGETSVAELQTVSQILSKESCSYNTEVLASAPSKRIRRTGRYDPQEREKKRRERNKMHAKKTREKKKQFFEESEKLLNAMVHEHNLLREYLISVKVMSRDEDTKAKQRDIEAEKELESFKVSFSDDESDDIGEASPRQKTSNDDAYLDDEEADDNISNYNDKDDEKLSNCSTNTTKEDIEESSSDRQQSGSNSSSVQLTSQQLLKSAVSKNVTLNSKFGGFYEVKNFRSGSVSDITSSASSSSSSWGYSGHKNQKSSTYSENDNNIENADAADSDNTSADNNRCNEENNFEVKSDGSGPIALPNTESYHHGIDVTATSSNSRNQSTNGQ